jgi:SAM-dependent methyltransferase
MHLIAKISQIRNKNIFSKEIVAFDLLEKLQPQSDIELSCMHRIYETIYSDVGTMKTFPGRYERADQLLHNVLTQQRRNGCISVIDVGASNGITSFELYNKLKTDFEVEVVAADLVTELSIFEHERSGWTFVLIGRRESRFRSVIQARKANFVVNFKLARKKIGLPRYLSNLALAALVRARCWTAIKAIEQNSQPREARVISLRHPSIATRPEDRFHFESVDMFDLPAGAYDIVRIMTVTQSLDQASFGRVLASVYRALRNNGLFILGFGKKEASIYGKSETGFRELASLSTATRHHRQVEAFRPA